MLAINAESWRWGGVRSEDVVEEKSLGLGINIGRPMALTLLPSDENWKLGSALWGGDHLLSGLDA